MPRLFCTLTLALLLPSLLFAQQDKKSRFKPIPDKARAAISAAAPGGATAKPAKERRVLVFYLCGGFVHQSIPFANFAVQTLGEKTGAFKVDLADSYDVFTPENLAKYDCILLNNTTHMQFPESSQLNAFLDFISKGKGLAGFMLPVITLEDIQKRWPWSVEPSMGTLGELVGHGRSNLTIPATN